MKGHTVDLELTSTLSPFDPDSLLRPQDAAVFLGFTPRALESWRQSGRGPVFVKISARAVRDRRRDLIAWADEHLSTSTSDPGKVA